MGFLSAIFGGNETAKAGRKNEKALTGFNQRGQTAIGETAGLARGHLSQIPGLYDPYAQSGATARTALDGSLGLGGPEARAAATSAFQAGPGYDFAVDESMRAAERGAAAGGMLASGNLMAELQQRGMGLANQEYGNWQDRLFQTTGQGMQAAAGQAGGILNQAQNETDILAQKLGLDASVTQGMNSNRNNVAAAKEQGVNNMLGFGQKFLGFL